MARSAGSTGAGIVARAKNLRPNHVATAARVAWWLGIARALLKLRGFNTVSRVLRLRRVEPVERARGAYPSMTGQAEQSLAWALRLLDRTRASCMPRSVVLERVLASRGVPADFVIGVDASDGFRAHAWVEVNGYAVGAGEQGASMWKPLARFRSADV